MRDLLLNYDTLALLFLDAAFFAGTTGKSYSSLSPFTISSSLSYTSGTSSYFVLYFLLVVILISSIISSTTFGFAARLRAGNGPTAYSVAAVAFLVVFLTLSSLPLSISDNR